ncbi:MAG: iron-sulfur cluster assembly scaffold protein [Cohaesibacter sp.]|nr:iron-sulfur cluster assembly scaffold protein [Cohaesibacter sp.]
MLDAIYNKKILEFAGNIERLERLDNPQASARAHSKLCGSTIDVDLIMQDGKVVDFGHKVNACALGQAAASVMARKVIGQGGDELRSIRAVMHAMLKEGGPVPQGYWEDLKYLEPVKDYPARHTSSLLIFDAVVDAVEQIERSGAQ